MKTLGQLSGFKAETCIHVSELITQIYKNCQTSNSKELLS